MIIPNIWENKIDVPNHQPEMECFLTQPGHPAHGDQPQAPVHLQIHGHGPLPVTDLSTEDLIFENSTGIPIN
jgi:hypothetical protein